MRNMGCFSTSLRVENPALRGTTREIAEALVDTGSEFTWVPGDVLRALGIHSERVQRFVVADGRELRREIGFAIVHVAGMSTADDVVFAVADDLVLLGARSLEGLNLRVDSQRKILVPAGPIITAGAA